VHSPGLLIVPVADEICDGRFDYTGSDFTAAVGPIRLYAQYLKLNNALEYFKDSALYRQQTKLQDLIADILHPQPQLQTLQILVESNPIEDSVFIVDQLFEKGQLI
jgi:hypothetical protein